MDWMEIDKTLRDQLTTGHRKAACIGIPRKINLPRGVRGARIRFYLPEGAEEVWLTDAEYKAAVAHFRCGEQC